VSCVRSDAARGIDVSYYQGTIDWARVRASGISFAFIRVSDGGYVDPLFATNWAGARAAGVLRGAYQFFRAGQDPIRQADMVAQLAIDPDLPPVVDVETTDGQTGERVVSALTTWINRTKALQKLSPLVYTGWGFWDDLPASRLAIPHLAGLWQAEWGVPCPRPASGWRDWVFWQTTEHGRVDGIPVEVDLDVFAGTEVDLDGLLSRSRVRSLAPVLYAAGAGLVFGAVIGLAAAHARTSAR
jgi:lysozyme